MNPQLNLNDIHLPDAVSVWPLALGWWLVLGVVIAILMGGWIFMRYWRKKAAYRLALQQLKALRPVKGQDDAARLADLAVFLRRAAMTLDQHESVAALTGQDWLNYLNRRLPDQPFKGAMGTYLITGAYQSKTSVDVKPNELWLLCQRWLKAQRKKQ